ncbi:MAG: hypothetical protein NTW50_01470 [Candidatus Berkelbacteria bacterium]|nr:hypothetical protein [Candidatus Berkelbacteria bacterium]
MDLVTKIFALSQGNDIATNVVINTDTNWTIGTIVGTAINWVSLIAGVVAFFYLIYSGFLYLTAGGNADAAKKGQQGILNAIIGIVIIALSYAIFTAVVKQFS